MRKMPDISPQKLGHYGNLHLESVIQNRPDLAKSLGRERLRQQCRDINAQAEARYTLLRKQGASHEQAEEVALEIVLVPDLETERAMRDGYTD